MQQNSDDEPIRMFKWCRLALDVQRCLVSVAVRARKLLYPCADCMLELSADHVLGSQMCARGTIVGGLLDYFHYQTPGQFWLIIVSICQLTIQISICPIPGLYDMS